MSHNHSPLLRTLTSALLTAGALTVAPAAQASNSFLQAWLDLYIALYPDSSTDGAGCAVCHGTGQKNLNAYGAALCEQFRNNGGVPTDVTDDLIAIEDLDSDGEDNGNLDEIGASAQPGWTSGLNPIFNILDKGCTATGNYASVPDGVPLPYDPVLNGDPVAVPGGPYVAYVNMPIAFDGSDSFDSDGGSIVSYTWDFGDGNSAEGATFEHTYTEAGTYTVDLTVVDDEGVSNTNSTTATISGDAVLDLDIATLKVSSSVRVGKPIAIQLTVENPGTVLGEALATVTGTQNGAQIYRWTLNVYDYNGKGTTSFAFPSYTATAKGTIEWSATIADVDPDPDRATAVTTVK